MYANRHGRHPNSATLLLGCTFSRREHLRQCVVLVLLAITVGWAVIPKAISNGGPYNQGVLALSGSRPMLISDASGQPNRSTGEQGERLLARTRFGYGTAVNQDRPDLKSTRLNSSHLST